MVSASLSELAGQTVALRVAMADAKLFSLTLACAAPPLLPGFASVEVAVNAQDYTATGLQLQVVQVAMHAVQPARGPIQGGTQVMVYGTHLLDVISCLFGGRAASSTEMHGRNRMTCTTNAFAASGWVAVQLAEGVHS